MSSSLENINLKTSKKPGRKPIYKTTEGQRDRNRRAQLAFRNRKNDYVARLEKSCGQYEKAIWELQKSNRAALARIQYLEKLLLNNWNVRSFHFTGSDSVLSTITDNQQF